MQETTVLNDILNIFTGIGGIVPILLIFSNVYICLKGIKTEKYKFKLYFLVFFPLIIMFWIIGLIQESEQYILNVQLVFMLYYIILSRIYKFN